MVMLLTEATWYAIKNARLLVNRRPVEVDVGLVGQQVLLGARVGPGNEVAQALAELLRPFVVQHGWLLTGSCGHI